MEMEEPRTYRERQDSVADCCQVGIRFVSTMEGQDDSCTSNLGGGCAISPLLTPSTCQRSSSYTPLYSLASEPAAVVVLLPKPTQWLSPKTAVMAPSTTPSSPSPLLAWHVVFRETSLHQRNFGTCSPKLDPALALFQLIASTQTPGSIQITSVKAL